MSGIDLIRRTPALAESGPVIMVADARASAQIVEAIQAGADDVVRRPYTADDLETAIRTAAGRARPERPAPAAEAADDRLHAELALLVSPQMREIQQVIEQAARADVTVLICGETGVGKEIAARAIHAHSPAATGAPSSRSTARRCRASCWRASCSVTSAAPSPARTSASPASSSWPTAGPSSSTRSASCIRRCRPSCSTCCRTASSRGWAGATTSRVDVRVICATNRDLSREVAAGRFREDLFYRLNVINILVPPAARAARGDSRPRGLFHRALRPRLQHARARARPRRADGIPRVTAWPGNIRELENFVKRMIVLQDWNLPRTLVAPPAVRRRPPPIPSPVSRGLSLKEISRRAVLEAERDVIATRSSSAAGTA